MTEQNPFAALFEPIATSTQTTLSKNEENKSSDQFNIVAEKVFGLTLRQPPQKSNHLFYMKDLAEALKSETFDQTALDQAVLEYAVGLQDSLVNYLFQCFERSLHLQGEESEAVSKTLFVNLDLAFSQSELFPNQKVVQDMVQVLAIPQETPLSFLNSFVQHCQSQRDSSSLQDFFSKLFTHLKNRLIQKHLLIGNHDALDAVSVLSRNPVVAKAMVASSILNESPGQLGKACENTLIGSLFLCSCIPRVPGTSDFFDRPSRSPPGVHIATEGNIWAASERSMAKVYKIMYNLFKVSPEVQNLTRTWIGNYQKLIY